MAVKQYVTGSKAEFLSWLPEIRAQIFTNFQIDQLVVRVHGKPDPGCKDIENVAELIYQEDAPKLAPDFDQIRESSIGTEDTRKLG